MSHPDPAHEIVLASKSPARAALLRAAGVPLVQVGAGVDEEAIRDSLRAEGAPPAVQAEVLAEAKAMKVSATRRGVILGADQMLDLDGEGFDKPATPEAARAQLLRLRGRTHVLQTALVACIDGAPVWRHVAAPRLTMRAFSEAFLDRYLVEAGPDALACVGGYQLEGRGVQLFQRIEGDYFSILGLPLLELLTWLRDRGTLPA